ncbi:hypothetical protein EMCRGX_G018999 [Ephydatia muelleri]|eukprot:Em0011g1049a
MADVNVVKEHHKQAETCSSRPSYREGRWEKAVKVYTINQESRYLLIQNIPALGVVKDLLELFSLYGPIEEYRLLDEYPAEPYTDVYWIKYADINSSRVAKRKMDNRSFFGNNLHVCYAPEYESVQETRDKLLQRKRIIWHKTKDTVDLRGVCVSKQQPASTDRYNPPPQTTERSQTCPAGPSSSSVPGLPPLPALPFPPLPFPVDQPYPSMQPVEPPAVGMSGKRRHMGGVGGCEGGGGSGYKPVGLSTSDRISLYMESKSAEGAVVATIGTATSVECKVSTGTAPQKKRRRI